MRSLFRRRNGWFHAPISLTGFGMPPFMPCGPGCTGDCQNPGGGGGSGGFPGQVPGGMNLPGFPPPSGPGPTNFPGSGGQHLPGPYPQPTEWPGSGPGNFRGPSGGVAFLLTNPLMFILWEQPANA